MLGSGSVYNGYYIFAKQIDENFVQEKKSFLSCNICMRYCLSTGFLSSDLLQYSVSRLLIQSLAMLQYWAVLQFCLLSSVCHHCPCDLCRFPCSPLTIFFRTAQQHASEHWKNQICFMLYSSKWFYSVPVDLGEMETESVGSNSTESQTSCQDNDVSISVICITIWWLLRILSRITWIPHRSHNLLCLGTVYKADQSWNSGIFQL